MSERITVRVAKEEDFDQVLQLSEGLHDGFDYLPGLYHKWLQSRDNLVLMAELQGKVVGLEVATIMPDRRSFIGRALRIHRDHRGKGLSYQIIHAVHAYVRQLYPETSRKLYGTTRSRLQVMAIARRMGDNILLEHNFYIFQVTKSLMPLLELVNNPIKELCSFSKEEAVEFVLNKQNSDAIIPHNIMVVGVNFYEAVESNVDVIFQDGHRMFGDSSLAEVRQGKTATSFSHGRVLEGANKSLWTCTVYTDDKVAFKAHVVKQLTSARQMIGQEFLVRVFHASTSSSFNGKTVLTDELFHLNQDIKVTSDVAVYFERKLSEF